MASITASFGETFSSRCCAQLMKHNFLFSLSLCIFPLLDGIFYIMIIIMIIIIIIKSTPGGFGERPPRAHKHTYR